MESFRALRRRIECLVCWVLTPAARRAVHSCLSSAQCVCTALCSAVPLGTAHPGPLLWFETALIAHTRLASYRPASPLRLCPPPGPHLHGTESIPRVDICAATAALRLICLCATQEWRSSAAQCVATTSTVLHPSATCARSIPLRTGSVATGCTLLRCRAIDCIRSNPIQSKRRHRRPSRVACGRVSR